MKIMEFFRIKSISRKENGCSFVKIHHTMTVDYIRTTIIRLYSGTTLQNYDTYGYLNLSESVVRTFDIVQLENKLIQKLLCHVHSKKYFALV